jgi:hypothetical protein
MKEKEKKNSVLKIFLFFLKVILFFWISYYVVSNAGDLVTYIYKNGSIMESFVNKEILRLINYFNCFFGVAIVITGLFKIFFLVENEK